jgi:hypothetical protein
MLKNYKNKQERTSLSISKGSKSYKSKRLEFSIHTILRNLSKTHISTSTHLIIRQISSRIRIFNSFCINNNYQKYYSTVTNSPWSISTIRMWNRENSPYLIDLKRKRSRALITDCLRICNSNLVTINLATNYLNLRDWIITIHFVCQTVPIMTKIPINLMMRTWKCKVCYGNYRINVKMSQLTNFSLPSLQLANL